MTSLPAAHSKDPNLAQGAMAETRVAQQQPRIDRRFLWAALAAAAAAFVFLLYRTDLLPASDNPDRVTEARSERASGQPAEPAEELAAVLDVLFRKEPTVQQPPETSSSDKPPAPAPQRQLTNPEHARAIQTRLFELGYLSRVSGTWGTEEFEALRTYKAVHGLGADQVWDEATERALFDSQPPRESFVGRWAPDLAACSPRNRTRLLPAIINEQGASAGGVSCTFSNARREGTAWHFAASCSTGRKRWSSRVKLQVSGDILTWSSERGSQTYYRCAGA